LSVAQVVVETSFKKALKSLAHRCSKSAGKKG
jgi:hypothetical protein